MPVTQVAEGLGSWSIHLSPAVPRETMDHLIYLGHICISAGRDDPRVAGDSLLGSARFVGPLRGITSGPDGYTLSGSGMVFWLGDEDDKGAVLEAPVGLIDATLEEAIEAVLPDSVTLGTIATMPGTFTGTMQYQTPRTAVRFICDTLGAVFRVNGDGSLDAGAPADMNQLTPRAAIIRRKVGADLAIRALPGNVELDEDVEDFTTRVVLYTASSDGVVVVSADADIDPDLNPFKDLLGNPVQITRLSQETTTDPATAPARAQLELNRYGAPRDEVKLSTSQYDITGDVQVGDRVWVHDPDARLFDPTGTNEIMFQGERLNPIKLEVNQLTWPVAPGMGVAYRDPDGAWIDLTDYVEFETGETQVTVGGYNRGLVSAGGGLVSPGTPVGPNLSIPDTPEFELPFETTVYQSANSALTRAQVLVAWTQPNNIDGSLITDGAFYEVRYRQADVIGGYQYARVPFFGGEIGGVHTALIQELTTGVQYSFEIRTADNGVPTNYSDWSDPELLVTGTDDIGPPTPAAPVVIGSHLAVMIVHQLGVSTGGTFNLPPDTDHFQVHASITGPTFTPSADTLLGKALASWAMIVAETPVVASFTLPVDIADDTVYIRVIAVDLAGNVSGPSAAATASAVLIDSAHISDLTVSKVTGGTISANWLLGADIATAMTGQRSGMNPDGFYAFDADDVQTFEVDNATGTLRVTGTLETANATRRIVIGEDEDGLARISQYDPDAPDGLTNVTMVASGGTWWMNRIRHSDGASVGGIIVYTQLDAYYGFISPGVAQYFRISADGISSTGFYGWDVSTAIASLVYYVFTTAGSASISYGATQIHSRVVQATCQDAAGSNPAYISASTSTGFTIASPTARSRYFHYSSIGVA